MRFIAAGNGALYVELDAVEFDPQDYAFERQPDATMQGVPKKDYSPGIIANAVLTLTDYKVRQLVTTWTIDNAMENTKEYEIELAEMENESTPERHWIPIGVVPEGETRELPHNIKDTPACYQARVIPVSINDVKGEPVLTNIVGVDDAAIDNLVDLGDADFCPTSSWQPIPNIPSNYSTAFDALQLGLTVATSGPGAAARQLVELAVDQIPTAAFTPTSSTQEAFTMPDGVKNFLYQTGGQIFSRILGGVGGQQGGGSCTSYIKDLTGVRKPMLMNLPALPRLALQIPDFGAMTYFVGDMISFQLPMPFGGQPPYTLSVMGLESWQSFDPATRLITGGPAPRTGTTTFTYCAEDSA